MNNAFKACAIKEDVVYVAGYFQLHSLNGDLIATNVAKLNGSIWENINEELIIGNMDSIAVNNHFDIVATGFFLENFYLEYRTILYSRQLNSWMNFSSNQFFPRPIAFLVFFIFFHNLILGQRRSCRKRGYFRLET